MLRHCCRQPHRREVRQLVHSCRECRTYGSDPAAIRLFVCTSGCCRSCVGRAPRVIRYRKSHDERPHVARRSRGGVGARTLSPGICRWRGFGGFDPPSSPSKVHPIRASELPPGTARGHVRPREGNSFFLDSSYLFIENLLLTHAFRPFVFTRLPHSTSNCGRSRHRLEVCPSPYDTLNP